MNLSNREMSMKSEKQTAKDLGMSLTKNSGANSFKGDMYNEIFCIEQKDTSKDSWIFRPSDIKKHNDFCISANLIPVFMVKFKLANISFSVYIIHSSYTEGYLNSFQYITQESTTKKSIIVDALSCLNFFGAGVGIERRIEDNTYLFMSEVEFKRLKGEIRDKRRNV